MYSICISLIAPVALLLMLTLPSFGSVITYTDGATVEGLSIGAVTFTSNGLDYARPQTDPGDANWWDNRWLPGSALIPMFGILGSSADELRLTGLQQASPVLVNAVSEPVNLRMLALGLLLVLLSRYLVRRKSGN